MAQTTSTQQDAAYESATALKEAHAQLLEKLDSLLAPEESAVSDELALAELEPDIERFLERGAATGVYLEEVKDRTACQVLLDYWVSSLPSAGRKAQSMRLARFDGERLPDLTDKPCPYVGLEAFRDQAFFFGREADTQALLEQIQSSGLVVVIGASGSGKSSLVMGGVLPQLRQQGRSDLLAAMDRLLGVQPTGTPLRIHGEPGMGKTHLSHGVLPDSGQAPPVNKWRVASPFTPGDALLEHLAASVLSIVDGEDADIKEHAARFRSDPGHLASLVSDTSAPPALITIDQFEEVFTLSAATDREALVANLAQLLEQGTDDRVILTVREEFRTRIVGLRDLEPFLDQAWYSVRPMGYEQLRSAVEKPAALVNLQFQSGIVDDLVKQVLGQPAALPLLQFTLRELWDERDRNRVTWEVYRRVGNPLEALKASADGFYWALAQQTRDEVKRILLYLVRVDELLEAYRQPVRMQELLEAGKANTADVVALLAENDYVRVTPGETDEDAAVEIRHEALIRNWPLLVGWIDEKRIERRQRLALTQAAERWTQDGKPAEGLFTGWQLEEAKRYGDLSDLEQEFVEASAAAVERAQRAKEEALRREAEQAKKLASQERKLRTRAMALLWLALAAAVAFAAVAVGLWHAGQRLADQNVILTEKEQRLSDENVTLTEERALLEQDKQQLESDYDELQQDYNELFAKQVEQAVAPESLPSSQSVRIFLHISQEAQRPRAEEIARQLRANNITVPGIEKVDPVSVSDVRYFRPEDKDGAEEIVRLLNKYLGVEADIEPKLIGGYEDVVSARHFEIWFATGALAPLKR